MLTGTDREFSQHLPVVEDTWLCPGEALPVSQAVHLARLSSGWATCENCARRQQTPQDFRPGHPSLDNASRRRTDIRRTEFGVRGAYLNAIDRVRATQLAAILSTHLNNRHAADHRTAGTQSAVDCDAPAVQAAVPATIVVGFDGRRGSPDIFAGVVTAVRQNGCAVIDAGRCTASSLLHVLRSEQAAIGAVLVTGAGGSPSDTGIDVFLEDGRSLAVPWQEFGVGLRLDSTPQSVVDQSSMSASVQQALHRIRRTEATSASSTGGQHLREAGATRLVLPDSSRGSRLFRSHRRCGSVVAASSESAYRKWLLRWWPRAADVSLVFAVTDELTADRLRWLTQMRSVDLQIRLQTDTESLGTSTSSEQRSAVTISIEEDDRYMSVVTARGKILPAGDLAHWMNTSDRAAAPHVTAHASPANNHLWLVDVASPESGKHQEIIADGLAMAGFLLTLMRDGRNPLPT